jgi:hypothetical protein
MIPFTGWDPERAETYLQMNPEASYSDVLNNVLGFYDPSIITNKTEEEEIMYQWLLNLDLHILINLYIALIVFKNINGFSFDYQPGHIIYKLLSNFHLDDPLLKYTLSILNGDYPINQAYKELVCTKRIYEDPLISIFENINHDKRYIESLYSNYRPSIDTKYHALIICFEQRNMDLRDTSFGVNPLTIKIMEKFKINPNETTFDNISCSRIRIDNKVFIVQTPFLLRKLYRYFIQYITNMILSYLNFVPMWSHSLRMMLSVCYMILLSIRVF